MPIILKGATSGQVTLDTPAIAGTNNLELPAATGTIQLLKLETAQATTSGTFKDFTGIPSWAKKITVMFNGVSTNGTSNILLQLGDAGGIETTGYTGSVTNHNGSAGASYSAGFILTQGLTAAETRVGNVLLTFINSNTWIETSLTQLSNGGTSGDRSSGTKTLSDILTQLRITTVNGTDTFDNGSVNILIEGN
jgi:hypothetical protein